jgi:hypothetical protein
VSEDIPDASGDQLDADIAELARTHPGRHGYAAMDRYRDFKAVFLGSDQGKRVLYEILGWGRMFQSSPLIGKFDTNHTFFHEGERNLALRIFHVARVEPTERPAMQSKT